MNYKPGEAEMLQTYSPLLSTSDLKAGPLRQYKIYLPVTKSEDLTRVSVAEI